jgi:adenylylsulfate kinase-like enzyme
MPTTPTGPLVVLWRGLPGAGKTTAARAEQARLRAAGQRSVLVGRDHLRSLAGLDPATTTPTDEDTITALQAALLQTAAHHGLTVLVDDTTLTDTALTHLTDLATRAGAPLEIRDLRDVPLNTCLARDATRTGTAHLGADRLTTIATTAGLTGPTP